MRPEAFTSSLRRWPLTARPGLGVAYAQSKPSSFLADFKNSALLSPKLYDVASWPYAVVCFAAAMSSLAAFSVIGQAMVGSAVQGGFTGDPSQLSFLDLHDGYSPDEARALLTAWGPYGRRLYLLVEGIDCTVYHAGYRGFLVVIANQLARGLKTKWPPAGKLVLLAALPVLLAAIDFLEDAGQVRAPNGNRKGLQYKRGAKLPKSSRSDLKLPEELHLVALLHTWNILAGNNYEDQISYQQIMIRLLVGRK